MTSIDPQQLADLVWQFDRKLRAQGQARWEDFLAQAKTEEARAAISLELLRCEAERHRWDCRWVLSRFKAHPELFAQPQVQKRCLRFLYQDAVAAEHPLPWKEFERFGFSSEMLCLREKSDILRLGQTVAGRYHIEQRLGAGSYGVVYRALDTRSRDFVALKAPRPWNEGDTTETQRFLLEEARLLKAAQGPGVPAMLNVITHENIQILCMEFVEGQPLSAILASGPVGPLRAARLTAQAARIIDRCHAHGHIHRDLKPENILVTAEDHLFIMDFGIGLREETQFSEEAQTLGTRPYMAPELVLGMTTQLDARTDIWSLGAILYELVIGDYLSPADSKEEAFVNAVLVARDDIPMPDKMPPALGAIIRRCTAYEPDQRFDTGRQLASRLEQWLEECRQDTGPTPGRPNVQAWRAGLALGSLRHAHASYHSAVQACTPVELGRPGPGDGAHTQKRKQLAVGLANATLILFSQSRTLLQDAGIEIPTIEQESKYQLLFYRGIRGADEVEATELADDQQKVQEAIETSVAVVRDHFANKDTRCRSLFELGLSLREWFPNLGADRTARLMEYAREATLPESIWLTVLEQMAAAPSGEVVGREIDRLDKRLERWLVYGEISCESDKPSESSGSSASDAPFFR